MNKQFIDDTVNPGEDFFKYATGHWIDYNPQPAEYPRWGTFTALSEENLKRVNKIIQKPENNEIGKKINQYYNIIMNWKKRNEEGMKPLLTYLYKNVYSLFTREDIIDYCAKEHCNLFWGINIFADAKNSDMNALHIYQSGLSLGNKEYYLSKDPDKKKVVRAWKKYCAEMYMALGKSKEVAKEKVKTIWSIEKKFAKVCYSDEECQEPSLNYHKKNILKLSKSLKFDLDKYIKDYGYDDSSEIIVCQERPIKLAVKLLNELPIEDLKTLVEWQILCNASLDEKISKIEFKFSKVLTGAKKQMPKKKRAIMAVDSIFGEAIGQIYISKYFSEEAKNDVQNLVNELIISYKNIIADQAWMSEETKKLALNKLSNIKVKVGYPDKIEDYSDCPIDSALSLFDNKIAMHKYFFNKNKEKYYNKPVDKDEWLMNPQEVNAYYNPTTNEICFPAGILQEPFYSYNRDKALNYGGIGVVIGHEMTHGYDNHGRQFDIDGNMKMWWKEDEIEKFNELAETTKKHFDSLEVLPGLNCNGSLTLGENLADYGGLKIAYYAYKNCADIPEEEWNKDFFLSYATVWAGVNTEEGIRHQTLNNEHSINYMRVNGTLPMFDPWYEAFNIKESNKLYVKPEDRAKIW